MVAVRFYSLSNNPSKPCIILKWPDLCVMLDCALDMRPLLNFVPLTLVENDRLNNLPQFRISGDSSVDLNILKDCNGQVLVDGAVEVLPPDSELINFSEIDVILVSNYANMLALPYVTSVADFKGVVYATDPTLQFGRQFYNLAEPNPQHWKAVYTAQDVQNCLSKIRTVSFRETLHVLNVLKVTPVSSGYAIGSCNWVMETDYEKIVYLSNSSVLTTHPKSIDTEVLVNADVLIVSSLSQSPTQNPDSMLGEFCCSVVSALKSGGNVLVPLYSTGLLYDLLEYLCIHLDNVGLSDVPLYVLSHSAESSLAFANIYGEWLAEAKQAKVFLPEEPFLHGFLLKNNRLKVFSSSYAGLSAEFSTPCIIFASHPSLRLGDAVHFMELWSGEAKNVVILTEPDFFSPEVLSPFQPLMMKALFCPIDPSLNFTQVNKLLEEIKPKSLYVPESYCKKPSTESANAADTSIVFSGSSICYRKNLAIAIPFRRLFRKMLISPALAAGVDMKKSDKSTLVSQIHGILSIYGNKLELDETPKDSPDKAPIPSPYGQLDVRSFMKELRKAGFDPCLTEKDNVSNVKLENEKVSIQIKPEETHITCDLVDENLRRKLRDIILNCLCKL